jgi:hypothetical protein
MGTTPGSTLTANLDRRLASPATTRSSASLLLALAVALGGCTSAQPNRATGGDTGGEGGDGDTGGKTGGSTGGKTGGSTGGKTGADTGGSGGGGTGGSAGSGTGGALAPDAGGTEPPPDAAMGTMADSGGSSNADAPPAAPRPDAMGQACKSAANEAFTVSAFEPQMGVFTAWFTGTPTGLNDVVGLSDGDVGPGSGDTPLHNLHQILIRFSQGGMIDARDGAAYKALTPIPYKLNSSYDFRLVVNVPAKNYSAYVTPPGGSEITIGTDLAYRDSARPATKFDHWAVQAVSAKMTVCGFLVRPN